MAARLPGYRVSIRITKLRVSFGSFVVDRPVEEPATQNEIKLRCDVWGDVKIAKGSK